MKITDVEAIPLRAPGVDEEFLDGSQDDVIIRVHTDKNIEGVGEVDASPEIVKAIVEAPTSHSWSKGLRELLIGEDPYDVERLWEKMYRGSIYYGRRGVGIAAISGVDIALWDVIGKAESKPISELFHGKARSRIKVYASLYPIGRTPQDVGRNAGDAVTKGFRAVKLDGAPLGQDPASDREILKASRKAVGDKVDLMTDVTEPGWDVREAVSRARMYSEYGVYFLEAPFGPDELEKYRKLSEAVNLRIAYGEQYTTRHEFNDLMDKGRVDVIQPDISRAGGITELRRIAQLSKGRRVQLIPHCWKTGISIAANLHFLAGVHNAPYLEFALPPNSPLRYDLLKRDFRVRDGYVEVPKEPGLGIELNEKTIQKYRIDH